MLPAVTIYILGAVWAYHKLVKMTTGVYEFHLHYVYDKQAKTLKKQFLEDLSFLGLKSMIVIPAYFLLWPLLLLYTHLEIRHRTKVERVERTEVLGLSIKLALAGKQHCKMWVYSASGFFMLRAEFNGHYRHTRVWESGKESEEVLRGRIKTFVHTLPNINDVAVYSETVNSNVKKLEQALFDEVAP